MNDSSTPNGTPEAFPGFPAGARATVVPNAFFAEVMPAIDDPAELMVTTYLFYALGRRRGMPRVISRGELTAEAPLRRALARLGDIEETLDRGLAAAIIRGTVLHARREHGTDGQGADLYLIHSDAAREAVREGKLTGVTLVNEPAPLPDTPPPSIYTLYEENIGTVSPLIADELREAETAYPPAWIVAAFREAVSLNKRNWRYVLRILERWRAEGRTDATAGRDLSAPPWGRDLEGRYRNLVRR